MKESYYGIIGGVAIVTFAIFVLLAGKCYIIPCETQIEVISNEIPEFVYDGNKLQGEFTIKNIGDVPAENCVLTWRVGDKLKFSNTFQLGPLEEKMIQITHKEILRRGQSESSWLWVSCENTETPKIYNNIEVKTL